MPGYEGSSASELGVNSAGVASFLVFGKLFSIFVGGLTFVIVARLLGPTHYGIYTLAVGLSGFVGAFGSISLGQYLNKRIPELSIRNEKEKLSNIIGVSLLITILFSLIVTLIGLIFVKQIVLYFFHSITTNLIIYVALFLIVISSLFSYAGNALVSFADGKNTALSSIINNSFQAAFSISLVVLGYGALGALLGTIIGLSIGFVYQFTMLLKHSKISLDLKKLGEEAKKMLTFSAPLTISGILGSVVNNFGVLYLGFLFVPSIVGLYGIASKIGVYIDLVIGSISAVLIPMFSTAMANDKIKERLGKLYSYTIYFGFLFAVPLVIYISVFSKALITSVFTSSYTGAPVYTALIGIGILLGLAGTYASSLVISAGYVKQVFKFGLISNMAELLSFLVLIPFFGVNGLILSIYYIGSIIGNIFYLRFVKSVLKLRLTVGIYRLFVANAVLLLLLAPISIINIKATYQLLLGFLVFILVYPILLGMFRAISIKELDLIKKVSYKLPVFGSWLGAIIIYAKFFQRERHEI
ncbi:MAG: oligosaccharide flippase family protein [Candidatus Micrarchaeia archaeon]